MMLNGNHLKGALIAKFMFLILIQWLPPHNFCATKY